MSNPEHLAALRAGTAEWNKWRSRNPSVAPDLRGADLRGLRVCGGDKDADHYTSALRNGGNLRNVRRDGADLRGVNFCGANLTDANLSLCDLSGADLSETVMGRTLFDSCVLYQAKLYWACMDTCNANNSWFTKCVFDRANLGSSDFSAAKFLHCSFVDASLFQCDLSSAEFDDCNIVACDLTYSRLVRTRFIGGQLRNSSIYGVSVWDVEATRLQAADLRITPEDQPAVTVDDLDIGQFLYLVLANKRLREAIEGMTGRMVLILGRFTPERKRVLNELRAQLRALGYISVIFDFDKPAGRDISETVSLLAHMSRFVLADITEPRSIPQELQRVAPSLPSVPIQPIILESSAVYSMFADFGAYASFLPPLMYRDDDDFLKFIGSQVLPAVNSRLADIQRRRDEFEAALARIKN